MVEERYCGEIGKMWTSKMEGEGELKGRRGRKRRSGGWRTKLVDVVVTERQMK